MKLCSCMNDRSTYSDLCSSGGYLIRVFKKPKTIKVGSIYNIHVTLIVTRFQTSTFVYFSKNYFLKLNAPMKIIQITQHLVDNRSRGVKFVESRSCPRSCL